VVDSLAGDVTECRLRCGARLNFGLVSTSGTVAGQHWDLSQPPMQVRVCLIHSRSMDFHSFLLKNLAMNIDYQRNDLLCVWKQASRWVEDVCRQAAYFGDKLRQVAGLTEHHRGQVDFMLEHSKAVINLL